MARFAIRLLWDRGILEDDGDDDFFVVSKSFISASRLPQPFDHLAEFWALGSTCWTSGGWGGRVSPPSLYGSARAGPTLLPAAV